MEAVFLKLLNMSIAAGWLVMAIILLRVLLKKAPKWLRVALWGLVGVRLLCPFSLESVLSLIPSGETVPPDILYTPTPSIDSGIPVINSTLNPVISEVLAPEPSGSVNPMQVLTFTAAVVWIVGMAGMLLYTLVSYLRLKHRVREAAPLNGNVWLCDRVATPFILGLVRPRIYLPSAMDEADRVYVIAHERAHLRRHDHWWKPLGFLLLTVYWFNPVLWLAYVLLCRDIELACDEKVIRELGIDSKKPYSEALIHCSVPRRMIAACPLAFGEVGVKSRIKSVLHYKKPAFWIILVAVLASVIVAVCFLTNPKRDSAGDIYQNGQISFYTETIDEGTKPAVGRTTHLTDEELDVLLPLLKKQTWVNDAIVDRTPFRFDGELWCGGWLYFGYEDRVLLYSGEQGTYFCTARDDVIAVFRAKGEAQPSPYSQVMWHRNVDGTVSVMNISSGKMLDYTIRKQSADRKTMLLASQSTVDGREGLCLVTVGETTGLQYAFDFFGMEEELYLCDIDGDKKDEIIVHRLLDTFGLEWCISHIFKVQGDELQEIFCSNPSRTITTVYTAGFYGKLLPNRQIQIDNSGTGYRLLLDASHIFKEYQEDTWVYFEDFVRFEPQDVNGDGVYEIVAEQYALTELPLADGGFVGRAYSVLSFNASTGTFDVLDAYVKAELPVISETKVLPSPTNAYASAIASCEAVVSAVLSDTFERDWNNGTLKLPSPNAALEYQWSNMIVEATQGIPTWERAAFGFAMKDINGDGSQELFFVRADHTVLAVFTLVNGHPQLLDAYWSRHRCVVLDQGFLYTCSSSDAFNTIYTLHWIDAGTGKLAEMRVFGYDEGVPFETVHSKRVTITEQRLKEIREQIPYAHGKDWQNTRFLSVAPSA